MKLDSINNHQIFQNNKLNKLSKQSLINTSNNTSNNKCNFTNALNQDTVSFSANFKFNYKVPPKEAVEIFRLLGSDAEITDDNKIILKKDYFPKRYQIRMLERVGLDEDSLFQDVIRVDGYVNLIHSKLTSLFNIKEIDGYLTGGYYLKDLSKTEIIRGSIDLTRTHIKDMSNVKLIGQELIHYIYPKTNPKLIWDGCDPLGGIMLGDLYKKGLNLSKKNLE